MVRALIPTLLAAFLVASTLFPMQVLGAAGTQVIDNEPETDARSCASAPAGEARCHARVRTDNKVRGKSPAQKGQGQPQAGTIGNGGAYDPAYLQSAYNLTTASGSNGSGQTVAIVDAFDDPNAEADLNTYRSHFGLSACTSATGCFRKVNQSGVAGAFPAVDGGWVQEISLDLDMVSAICPRCNILLVEASSASFSDLGTAVNTAATLGATAISNSYGTAEWSGETGFWESFYNHPGIAVTASAGDGGYGVEFPAATSYTIAVGGTSLNQLTDTGSRNATESVWSGTGAGCSAYEPKPTWQHDTGCAMRTVADVAAVADPGTGVWVYDTTAFNNQSGWLVFGGTSVAAPIVASVYALAANHAVQGASGLYATGASLFDVVSGNDGVCGGMYLCTGMAGYDGPTGNGAPNGTTAFSPGGTSTATATPTSTSTPTATATPTSTTVPSTSTPTPTPTTVTGATTVGLTSIGTLLDDGDRNSMNGSRVVIGAQSLSVSAASAYVDAVDAAPRNQFSMAIYADTSGAPGALVARSAAGTLKASAWNTLPISATLQANTAYWLMYNTNASTRLLNNLHYNADPSSVGAFHNQTFGTWPASFGPATLGGWRFSMYLMGSPTSPAATATPTNTVAAATATPTNTLAAATATPTTTVAAATATPTNTPPAPTNTPTLTPAPTATATPTVTPTSTSTPTAGTTTSTLGLTTIGAIADTGDANFMNGSRVVAGAQGMTASSVSGYVGSIGAAPNNQFSFAIYTDLNGAPGALVAQTSAGTLKANSWNTLPITATLTANTAYWVFYNTNGSSSLNNLYMNDDPSPIGAYAAHTFGTWPTTFGVATTGGWRYSIYITGSP